MELIVVLAIIIGLLLLIGVQWQWIALGAMALVGLLLVAMVLFFVGTFCFLFLFRRRQGRFLRFEHAKHFEIAVYEVDGQAYRNWFPAEPLLRSRIYHAKMQTVRVRRLGDGYYAFDRHSLLIELFGLVASVAGLVFFFPLVRLLLQ